MPLLQKKHDSYYWLNSLVLSEQANHPNVMRELYMDNRYSVPHFFAYFGRSTKSCLQYCYKKTQSMGCHSYESDKINKKGLIHFIIFDPINRVLFGQWNENKVVSYNFSLGKFQMSFIKWCKGANFVEFLIDSTLKQYASNNFMGGVDDMDKDNKIEGSFRACAMFRKWFRKGLMVVLILFLWVANRLGTSLPQLLKIIFNLAMLSFIGGLAEEMIRFRDESDLISFAKYNCLTKPNPWINPVIILWYCLQR